MDKIQTKVICYNIRLTQSFVLKECYCNDDQERFEKIFNNFFSETTYTFSAQTEIAVAENIENSFVKIYPNPGHDIIHISLSDNDLHSLMEVYNIAGQKIFSQKLEDFNSRNDITLNISTFGKGIYFIKFAGKENNSFEKLIIK